LQASTMGRGSEIFVLDMGEPVRIVDLAQSMIRLSGLVPDRDIEIRYTGLRPGEKLYEELKIAGENMSPTGHQKIHVFQGPTPTADAMEAWIVELYHLLECRDESKVVAHLCKLVPEYASKNARIREELVAAHA
jgi:FlaA1/EpsC-like NDP-sugar epimerase